MSDEPPPDYLPPDDPGPPIPDPVRPDPVTSQAALRAYLVLFQRVPRDEVHARLNEEFTLLWPDASGQTGFPG